ncbi:MAG: nucleotide exchange factor GrpE [Planctomycetaceae bacterium]|jgi:molecular chaperone GrpE|nr:nucleotide exchange factor GrpE [Planctomycetaceae bacterium]
MIEHDSTTVQQPNETFPLSSENIIAEQNFILVPTEPKKDGEEKNIVAEENQFLNQTETEEEDEENIVAEENQFLNQTETEDDDEEENIVAEENQFLDQTETEEDDEEENIVAEENQFLDQTETEDFEDFEQILFKLREETLKHFIDWFTAENETDEEEEALPKIGFYQVFETLTAQRHEFKLFTKSNRQTQELLEKNIEETSQTLAHLRRLRKERPEIERKAIQPYLMSLIEIDEAIQRAGAALKVLQDRLTGLVFEQISILAKSYCDGLTLWQRFWQRKAVRHFAEYFSQQHISEIERILEPFRLGYEMMQIRMDDVLKKHLICRLNPVGEQVNPETMRVLATVEMETVEQGRVIEVVRAGYLWRNKPIRFADVRVAVRSQTK